MLMRLFKKEKLTNDFVRNISAKPAFKIFLPVLKV